MVKMKRLIILIMFLATINTIWIFPYRNLYEKTQYRIIKDIPHGYAFMQIPLQDLPIMLSISETETRHNPLAIGKAGELGMCQIHPYWYPEILTDGNWQDPVFNVSIAYKIYKDNLKTFGSPYRALCAYNGDWSGGYANKVLEKSRLI